MLRGTISRSNYLGCWDHPRLNRRWWRSAFWQLSIPTILGLSPPLAPPLAANYSTWGPGRSGDHLYYYIYMCVCVCVFPLEFRGLAVMALGFSMDFDRKGGELQDEGLLFRFKSQKSSGVRGVRVWQHRVW
ncbi:hypothetical protein SODALDRAFT_9041 [Sodiomyces alkalinus F11]|uniref:Uncharacterized protein n=1 Tax=Sodiomyces alkalinus (strain CBS 110278 / VKM F-3762 / F11) TaxID=1314773 RepID=A0A3N2Q685_SODAK|nr:hypothetical protein SODALDRAFT_9041 [Sodiomyces alkalinus F11]ROT42168.1 hypothetical protein SODALDRAFT_9041 [Sodiomyces alkalinus F11]